MSDARSLLDSWLHCVNKRDLEALMLQYHPKAVLIPTFSNRILSNPESIRDYFTRLAAREELSVALHEKTVIIQTLEAQTYALHGIYCWRFLVDEEMFSFEARFSFLVNLSESQAIYQHHSSQIPRMI